MPRFTGSKTEEMYYDIDDLRDLDEKDDLGYLDGVSRVGRIHTTNVQCEVYEGEDFTYGTNKTHRKVIGRGSRFNNHEEKINHGRTIKVRRNSWRVSSKSFNELIKSFEVRKDA